MIKPEKTKNPPNATTFCSPNLLLKAADRGAGSNQSFVLKLVFSKLKQKHSDEHYFINQNFNLRSV